jgi:RNA polymerase sigma-70 factor (ECF subfamily)
MIQYQAGEVRAMDELVAELSPRLLNFFGGAQASRSDAEDLLQECWLRLHRARHTYRSSEPLLPWVFAIARHTKLDGFRRRQRRIRYELLMAETPEPPTQSEPPSSGPDVLRLLEELPQSQKEVVEMLKVSGMSLEDVARATGSSLGAVKQRAHRAYTTLRERWGKGI